MQFLNSGRIVGFVSLLCLALIGCKSMTKRQAQLLEQKKQKQEKAEAQVVEQKKEVEAINEEEAELQRTAEKIQIKLKRQEKYSQAITLLSKKQSQAALQLASELIAEVEVEHEAYLQEKEDRKALEEKLMQEKEKASESTDRELAQAEAKPAPKKVRPLEDPSDPAQMARFLVVQATALYDLGDLDQSKVNFIKACDLDGNNRDARNNAARLCYADGEYEEAISYWRKELAAGYRSGEVLRLMGQALYEVASQKQDPTLFAAARIALQDALVEDPENKKIRQWLAILSYESGYYEDSLRMFKAMLKVDPANTSFIDIQSRCYVQLKMYEEAIDSFELLAKLQGDKVESTVMEALIGLYRQMKMPASVAMWVKRRYGPEIQQVPNIERYFVGIELLSQGEVEDAKSWLEAVDKETEYFEEAQLSLIELMIRQGNDSGALSKLSELRKLKPKQGHLHLLAGDIHLRKSQWKEAGSAYECAIVDTAASAEAYAGLAEADYGRGRLKSSVSNYGRALALEPENAAYRIALKQIQSEMTKGN